MEDPGGRGYVPGGVTAGLIVHFCPPAGQGYRSDRHLAAIITRVHSVGVLGPVGSGRRDAAVLALPRGRLMGVRVLRRRSLFVLDRTMSNAAAVSFRHNAGESEELIHRGPISRINLIRSDWEELGSPESLTVTIEPGDLLNPPEVV